MTSVPASPRIRSSSSRFRFGEWRLQETGALSSRNRPAIWALLPGRQPLCRPLPPTNRPKRGSANQNRVGTARQHGRKPRPRRAQRRNLCNSKREMLQRWHRRSRRRPRPRRKRPVWQRGLRRQRPVRHRPRRPNVLARRLVDSGSRRRLNHVSLMCVAPPKLRWPCVLQCCILH